MGCEGELEGRERSQRARIRSHVEGCELEKIVGGVSDIEEGR